MRSIRADQHALKTPDKPQRSIAINDVTRAATTSVWYYRVDVSVHEEGLRPTFISEDESDDNCSDEEAADIEHYSILKRYNDFLELYEKIRAVVIITDGSTSPMPRFPAKESISPALMGLVKRSSSETVLEERRVKFEALLQWIENHPVARDCPAFITNNIYDGEPQTETFNDRLAPATNNFYQFDQISKSHDEVEPM
ncbi:hypothetical protein PHMEG_00019870, partial [Phytophthora megakarya]